MKTITVELDEVDLVFERNLDQFLAVSFEKAGLKLPPMSWLILANHLDTEEKERRWRDAFAFAKVKKWANWKDEARRKNIWRFEL